MHGRALFAVRFVCLNHVIVLIQIIRNLVQQPLRIIPSQTGIGDGFAVAVFPDFLAAGLNIALNHEALYQIPYISGVTAAVEHFFGNANLFLILLVRVGVVCVHDTGRILQSPLVIQVK